MPLLPAWKVVLSRLLSGPLSWVFRPGRRAPVWLAFRTPAGRGLPSSPAMAPWVAHRFGKRFPFLFDVFLFRFAVSPASRPQTRPSPGGLQDLRACGASVPPHGARRQLGARSPSTPPRGGPGVAFASRPRLRRPAARGEDRAWPAAPAAGPSLSARPSPPQAASFPLTCSLEVKPSGESPVLDFPELGRKIRVSYSFCFSAETCDSRVSSFLACSPRPPPPPPSELCSPRWAQGRADLGLRVRGPVPTPRPPDPQLGAEVPDTEFLPFSKRARFWSGRPCVCECGFMRCWVVSEARPRCSPSSRDSARLRVQTPSPRLPSGRWGGLGV